MRKIAAKIVIAALLSSSILIVAPAPLSSPVHADAAAVVSTSLSKPVSIEGRGTIELKTIFAVPSPEGKVVTFNLDVVNTGNDVIDFNRYWLRIDTGDLSRSPMYWVNQSKNLIYPGQRHTLTFYTVLPNATDMANIKLRLVKWDMSHPNFERDLGQLPIQAAVIPTLGRSLSKFIGLTNNQIEAQIELSGVNESARETNVRYTVHLMNKGQFAYALPSYEYVLVTNAGVAYPLTANGGYEGGGGGLLLPWLEQSFGLSGTVPSNVDLNEVALYILHPYGGDRGQVKLPVTVFRTFEKVSDDPKEPVSAVKWGTKAELVLRGDKGEDSTATLSVTSIQRFPWDHRDLLSAQVKLTNTGDKKVWIPSFQGQFKLGSEHEVVAEVVPNGENETYLYPGGSVTFQALGFVSYISNFNIAYIELSEEDSGEYQKVIKAGSLPPMSFTNRDTDIAKLDLKQSYVIGENSFYHTVQFVEADTFTSTHGNMIVSRLLVSNLEQRGIKVPALKAFYRTKNGMVYPATTATFEESNYPRGASVISFYVEIPGDMKQEDLILIVGEEIADKGLREGVSYQLYEDTSKKAQRIATINYYPYELQFSNFYADSNGLHFKFKKEKDYNTKANISDRKLVMEFTNVFGDRLDEKEIILEGAGAWKEDMRVDIPYNPTGIGNDLITVTIYDVFKDGRKPLAEQTFFIFRLDTP